MAVPEPEPGRRDAEFAPPPADFLDTRTWTTLIHVLLLGGVFAYVTAVIGAVVAYVKRDDLRGSIFESHITYALRTFWIGLFGGAALAVLSFVLTLTIVLAPVAWLIGVGALMWWLYRTLRGALYAWNERPIPDPQSWF